MSRPTVTLGARAGSQRASRSTSTHRSPATYSEAIGLTLHTEARSGELPLMGSLGC